MRRKIVLLASSGFLSAMSWSGAAQAQSTPGAPQASTTEIDDADIIVTARRRDEKLSDIPAAISVIDVTSLTDRGGAYDARQLLADQPSVRFNNLQSTNTSEISIRASSTARATNGDPSIGLYRDGAYVGGGAVGGRNFSRLDFLDIGRVEVLRGTQGALYGRNAVGGTINIVSARPEFNTSGFVHVRYDFETEGKQAQGAVNLGLSDNVAIRVSADGISQTKGFFYNPNNDVYFDRNKGYAVRGQVRFKTGPIDLTLLAETQDLSLPDVYYQVAIARGTPGFPGGFIQPQFTYSWNTRPDASQKVQTYQGLLSLDLGSGITLSSTTSYRRRKSAYSLDADGTDPASVAAARASGAVVVAVDASAAAFITDTTTNFYQDVHLGGKSSGFTWLAGGDLVILKSNYVGIQTRTPTVLNPSPGTRQPSLLKFRSYAAYGSVGYDLTTKLNFTGELRYTKDDRSIVAGFFDLGTGAPLGGAARAVNARTKPENLSYNATLSYKFGGGILGYAKVGSSYRAGGFNVNLGDIRQPIPIDAAYGNERSTTYEVGLRGAPGQRLFFAIAGYYTNINGLIAQTDNGCAVTNPVCPVAPTTFLTTAGKARSYGVEAELSKTLPVAHGQFRFALTASYQNGKVTSGVYNNLRLPQVPDFLYSANVNFRHDFIGGTTLVANALYTVQLGGLQELRANSVKLDDFDLINLRLGIEKGKFTFSVFADNVGNQVYRVTRDTTINRYSLPRVIGVEASFRW